MTDWGWEMVVSKPRLLLVEDDVTLARSLSRALSGCGFMITIAHSCAAALRAVDRFEFGVLDLELPDGNGVSLGRGLLAESRVRSMVFFTGCSDPALLARARRVAPVVTKSAGVQALLARLTGDGSDAPQSRTARSTKPRADRPSSSTLRKQRGR